MRLKSFASFCIIGIFVLFTSTAYAQRVTSRRGVGRRNPLTGLYGHDKYISSGITFGGNVAYYYGDADHTGLAFNGGFNKNNIGGCATVYYTMGLPATGCLNLRFGLQGGIMRGNNKEIIKTNLNRDDYRIFKNYFIEPSIGVEIYPFAFLGAGFYLYGGVSFTAGIIEYDYAFFKRVEHKRVLTQITGNSFGFLPMAIVGIGYSWPLGESWLMSAELMLHEGFVDTYYMNLDCYPMAPSQNTEHATIGRGAGQGKWVDQNGELHMRWDDGWFQFGFAVSYRFR